MSVRFDEPVWLLLLIAALPMGAAALVWLAGVSRARRWSAVLLRTALVGLIAGALAGTSMVRSAERLAVVGVVDLSGSVTRNFDAGTDARGRPVSGARRAADFLRGASVNRRADDLMGLVAFDGTALAVAAPTTGDPLVFPIEAPGVEGTNVEAALRLAGAMIPPGATGRIVLFSDGNQTAGDALRGAAELAGSSAGVRTGQDAASAVRRVPVDVVPLTYSVSGEVIVESVDAPPVAPADATVTVRVVLNATDAATGTLTLLREGVPVDIAGDGGSTRSRRVSLPAGRSVERLTVRLPPGRIHRFEAVFEADRDEGASPGARARADRVAVNNRGEAFTLTPGKGSVLIVDGVGGGDPAGGGAVLADALRGSGLDVTLLAPEAIRPDPLSLQPYDLVILQNVAADAISRPTQQLLASYVSDLGGGLVMVGGPDSFGAGGWKGTPVEPILPVRLDLPEKLIVPGAAVVIVLDRSGSMNARVTGSRRSQQQIAVEGAAVAITSMDKTDLVGVISFNENTRVDIPLAPNADPEANARTVREIWADGGTVLPPALEEAHRQLREVKADVKHVIVLSDGRSQGTELLSGIAERMKTDGIKISTIAVGDGADTQTLSELASATQGRFYRVVDPTVLPRIFVKAVRVVRTPSIREQPFRPVIAGAGSPLVDGLAGAEVPELRGLVLTQPRADRTIVMSMVTPTGEPVLASWNAGLGRVAAFTSDAHRWASDWVGRAEYSRLWTQIVRAVARPPADRTQQITTELVGDELLVRLEATGDDGRPIDLLSVPGAVYGPAGERKDVRLTQTAPGTYEARVPAAESGSYVVALTPRLGNRALAPVLGGASRPAGVEFRALTSNAPMLRELASATGGRVLSLADPGGANLFSREGVVPAEARVPLWRTLMLWAVIVMLLDVATRRIAWDRLLSREFGASVRRETAANLADRGKQAQAAVERLKRIDAAPARRPASTPAPSAASGAPVAASPESEFAPSTEPVAGGPLGVDDAREIVRQEAERRRRTREAARTAATSPEAPPAPKPTPGPEGEASPEGGSSLLEAKRRARRRMDEDAGGGGESDR
jgi:Ca-activated chloride channel homolog